MGTPIDVILKPDPADWRRALERARSDDAAREVRASLGLPTDRPIVMTGHQAEIWHPGILAKFLAAEVVADTTGAAAAWLVVDQDAGEPGLMRYPTRRRAGEREGRLEAAQITCPPSQRVPGETPTGSMPTLGSPEAFPDELAPTIEALAACADASDAAGQVTGALTDLMRTRVGIEPRPWLRATALSRTGLFARWLDRMRSDPAGCVESYNAAAERTPGAGIRPLIARPSADRYELPLWRVRPGEPRTPVYSVMLDDIPIAELAPRAILMTALVRRAACDLFIHGTGGGAYDGVADRWISDWLGETLSPMVVASATCTLDLGVEDVSDDDVARAAWRAHAARHNPGLIGDDEAARRKRAMLEKVESARAAGEDPTPHYRAMHAALAEARDRHGQDLAAIDREVERLRGQRADAEISAVRTWPFTLYPDATLAELREKIRAAFEMARSS